MSDDNVTQFPGAQQKLQQSIKEVFEDWAATLEYISGVARIRRAIYNAYIEEGFTEEQALELTKSGLQI